MALTKIDDRGLKTPIDLLDTEKIRLGTGNDLELYHDGTDNFITTSNGHLNIYGDGTNEIYIRGLYNEDSIVIAPNGGVELYYDNVKKLNTNPGGIKVIGNIACDGDNQKLILGANDDFQLYHNGSYSIIDHGGPGDLYIESQNNFELHVANGEDALKATANGAVELYYDNSKKFETDSGGVTVTDGNASVHLKLVSSSGTAGYFYGSGNTNVGFLDAGGNWAIQHVKDTHTTFSDTNASRLRIDSDGIKFGSDTAAANALDDCEKGTWNPVLKFSNQTTSYTVSVAQGSYQKIGNLVYCKFVYELNGGSAGVSGTPEFHGLPFTVSNDLAGTGQEGFGQLTYWQSVNSASNYIFWVQDGGTVFNIIKVDGSGSGQTGNASSGDFNSSTAVRGSLVYMASS